MTLDEFRHLLEAYGADPVRWPEDRRPAARALIAESAAAREALESEAAFDRMLGAAMAGRSAAGSEARLTEALVAARPRAAPPRLAVAAPGWRARVGDFLKTLWPYGPPLVPASSLAMALVLGIGLGSFALERVGSDGASDDPYMLLSYAEQTYSQEWTE